MTSTQPAPQRAPTAAPSAFFDVIAAMTIHDLATAIDALTAELRTKARDGQPLAAVARFGSALREHAAAADRLTAGAKDKPLPEETQRFKDAIDHLDGSERGHAALVRFRKLLEAGNGYACGLDSENWACLADVVRACRIFGAYKLLEFLPRK